MTEDTSLAGLSIVNTRAAHQAQPLTAALAALGANVLHYPAIHIAPPIDPAPLDAAITQTLHGDYDWLVLTSANTVHSLAQRLAALGQTGALAPSSVRVAAVGPATAEAASRLLGVQAARVPDEFVAESLATTLALRPGQRVFLPQSAIARPFLAHAFTAAGASVTPVVAYRTAIGQGGDPVPQLLRKGRIDAVTFTSPSTVRNFLTRLQAEGGYSGRLVNVVVACIGPKTAAAARQRNLPVQVIPAEHTIGGLVEGLGRHFSGLF